MRQLTSLDTQFLAVEDGNTHGHVSGLGIYDPGTAPGAILTRDSLTALVAQRIHLLPPFRWRLVEVPLGLDHPYWVDAPDVDLEFHIRELGLPAPGDDRQLAEQVGRIVARPLDRARPLWELYIIQGLADGRVGVLTKIHHAAVDGMSGAEVLSVLLDPSAHPEPQPAAAQAVSEPPAAPGPWAMLARGLAGIPSQRLRALRALPRALPFIDENPTLRTVPGIGALAAAGRIVMQPRRCMHDARIIRGQNLHAPLTPLNAPIGPHRRIAFSRQSLHDVKRVKDHFGVTINDVVLAICAGALRSFLDARGELPDAPLLAMVPMSVRTPEQSGTFGNRVTTMLAPIPTHIADPAERVCAAQTAMNAAKERHQAVPATVLQDTNEIIPPAIFASAARITARIVLRHPTQALANTIISNVPGSPVPLYLAGARLEALYPISAVTHGIGLNITVMSYCGGLDFGIVADHDLVNDAWAIAAALREAQAELVGLVSTQSPIAVGPRPGPDRVSDTGSNGRDRCRAD